MGIKYVFQDWLYFDDDDNDNDDDDDDDDDDVL